MSLTMKNPSDKKWYVLRDLKRPNAKEHAYQALQNQKGPQIEVFTPLTRRASMRGNKKVYEEVPFINDLLFVHESRAVLDPIIRNIPTLQYRYAKGCIQNEPMTVRDLEMNRFIQAVHSRGSIKYYRPEEVSPAMYNRMIRIIGGPLDGCEGRLMTIRGSKVKRLIVELPGILAIGVEVQPEYIQLLDS